MTNTFLVLLDAYNRTIRVRADSITSYVEEGRFTTLLVDGATHDVQHTAEELDKALTESYFMIKPVTKGEL